MGWGTHKAVFIAAFIVAAPAAGASAPSINDAPPPLQKAAQCMLAVLKQFPGVDQERLGVVNSEGWVHPYLEYRSQPSTDGDRQVIRFEARKSSKTGHYDFKASLKNVLVKGEPGPNFWGTGVVREKWKSACGVDATVDW